MAYWNMQKGSIDMKAGRPGSKFTTKKYWRMSMQKYHSFSTAGSRGGPHTLYEGRLLISIHKNCENVWIGEDGICIHIAILQGMSERLQRAGSFLLLLFFWQGLARCHRLAWNLPRRSHCPWPHHPLDCRAYRAQASQPTQWEVNNFHLMHVGPSAVKWRPLTNSFTRMLL